MRLAHISDLHFGRIRDSQILSALRRDIRAAACDAVIVTGDLTQRARPRQYLHAHAWLRAFKIPSLIIAGNHDVHAWWHRPDLRLLDPLRRYKRMVSPDLNPYMELPGVAILGLNSAHGCTVKGGFLPAEQVDRVYASFGRLPKDTVKILAVHHPLVALPDVDQPWDVARGGSEVWDAAVQSGVDIICCGHGHVSHIGRDVKGVVVSIAGTATSDRWRSPQEGVNSWHLIQCNPGTVDVEFRTYESVSDSFVQQLIQVYKKGD